VPSTMCVLSFAMQAGVYQAYPACFACKHTLVISIIPSYKHTHVFIIDHSNEHTLLCKPCAAVLCSCKANNASSASTVLMVSCA
jgi:hypothetical protein